MLDQTEDWTVPFPDGQIMSSYMDGIGRIEKVVVDGG
jgi:hypothetical protein